MSFFEGFTKEAQLITAKKITDAILNSRDGVARALKMHNRHTKRLIHSIQNEPASQLKRRIHNEGALSKGISQVLFKKEAYTKSELKELIPEHKHLIRLLRSGSKKAQKHEAAEQAGELKGYLRSYQR